MNPAERMSWSELFSLKINQEDNLAKSAIETQNQKDLFKSTRSPPIYNPNGIPENSYSYIKDLRGATNKYISEKSSKKFEDFLKKHKDHDKKPEIIRIGSNKLDGKVEAVPMQFHSPKNTVFNA